MRVKLHPELTYFVLPQDELDKVQDESVAGCFCALFPKDSTIRPLFNEAIKKMRESGDLAKIYEKWVGQPMPPFPAKDKEY